MWRKTPGPCISSAALKMSCLPQDQVRPLRGVRARSGVHLTSCLFLLGNTFDTKWLPNLFWKGRVLWYFLLDFNTAITPATRANKNCWFLLLIPNRALPTTTSIKSLKIIPEAVVRCAMILVPTIFIFSITWPGFAKISRRGGSGAQCMLSIPIKLHFSRRQAQKEGSTL